MNSLEIINYFESYKSSIKTTSKGGKGNHPMINSKFKVINFDSYVKKHLKMYPINSNRIPNSNDALFYYKDTFYFIEFKKSKEKNIKRILKNIYLKFFESLLILLETLDETISYSRKNINYILVYDEDDNPRDSIISNLHNLSIPKSENKDYEDDSDDDYNYNYKNFGLEKFENLYVLKVYTYTKSDFEREFLNKFKIEDKYIDMFEYPFASSTSE